LKHYQRRRTISKVELLLALHGMAVTGGGVLGTRNVQEGKLSEGETNLRLTMQGEMSAFADVRRRLYCQLSCYGKRV